MSSLKTSHVYFNAMIVANGITKETYEYCIVSIMKCIFNESLMRH